VSTDFPWPASDYTNDLFDLKCLLQRYSNTIYFVQLSRENMEGTKIHEGNLLVVDKQINAKIQAQLLAVVLL
jgi:DNA polymerase V